MSQKNVYKWYKDFKEGRERVDDLERPGRPPTSTDEIEFNKCFDDWKKRWHKCIISGGDYFEGDEIYLDK